MTELAVQKMKGETHTGRLRRLIESGATVRDLRRAGATDRDLQEVGFDRSEGPKVGDEMWLEPCGWVRVLDRPFEIGAGNLHVNVRNRFKEELCVPLGDLQ